MKITYKGDYALKALHDLSLRYGDGVVTIHQMARRLDIPVKFLEQILLDLKRGGFVESRRGKIGGYRLAKPPSKIRLGEVIEFIEGPIKPIACVDKNYSGCRDISSCVFKKVWQQVNEQTSKIVNNITFEDLKKRSRPVKKEMYYI